MMLDILNFCSAVRITQVLGPDSVQKTTEKIRTIKKRMKATPSRQKAYADQWRRPLKFMEGDKVFLKVFPMNGVVHVRKKSKLNPRYIGPFEELEKDGSVANRLALPP